MQVAVAAMRRWMRSGWGRMRRLSARVSDRARAGWDRATARHGCTFSALVEALGQALNDGTVEIPEEVAKEAQRIDRERFSRR